MFKKILSISLTIFLLFGCGGGGSSTTIPQPVAVLGNSTLPSANHVVEYLRVHAGGGPWETAPAYPESSQSFSHDPGLIRFAAPPVVRLAEGISGRERAISLYAISLINRALPYEQHLRIGPDTPANPALDWERGLPNIPDGQIFIVWGSSDPGARAHSRTITKYDAEQERWEKKGRQAGAVEISSNDFLGEKPDWLGVSVVIHEMLHVLGFDGHVGEEFAGSIMHNAGGVRSDGSLPDIDIAALQALYLRLKESTEPEELSIQSLGVWDDESTDITSSLGPVSFGVRHANGVSVPFTSGPEPPTSLAESGLRGTITWEGDLIGVTPEIHTITGDAAIGVNLATMNGTANFTNLRSFANLVVPTPEGGTMWGDGTLDYNIRVGRNYLHSTGGDDGVVSGSFYGNGHRYVSGTVERTDLTAAFGGKR